jgi:hypothetical protein
VIVDTDWTASKNEVVRLVLPETSTKPLTACISKEPVLGVAQRQILGRGGGVPRSQGGQIAGRAGGHVRWRARPGGVPNKATLEAKQACAEIVDDPHYRVMLIEWARTGALPPAVETMLWYYAKGKPKETIEHQDRRDVATTSDAELESALRLSMEKLGYKVIPVAE